jgi:choline dehydrogenase-like flavoprotein
VSGIGDRGRLESIGIHVAIDNPNVGEHLQDHPIVCQGFEVHDGIPSGDALRDPSVLQSLVELYSKTGGDGPLGQSTLSVAYAPLADGNGVLTKEAAMELLDRHPISTNISKQSEHLTKDILQDPKEPAVEYLLFPSQANITDKPDSMMEIITPARPENYITIMTILNYPFSRGNVHTTSADVADKPQWDPNFLSHPLDLEILARNVQFVENISKTEAMSSVLKTNGLRHPSVVVDDLEKARDVVRQATVSVFHPAGSCAMLPREQGGVVDHRLVVHGTKNVRVVDASIFPLEPLGNIQSTVYAVAERAADLIKEDLRKMVEK